MSGTYFPKLGNDFTESDIPEDTKHSAVQKVIFPKDHYQILLIKDLPFSDLPFSNDTQKDISYCCLIRFQSDGLLSIAKDIRLMHKGQNLSVADGFYIYKQPPSQQGNILEIPAAVLDINDIQFLVPPLNFPITVTLFGRI